MTALGATMRILRPAPNILAFYDGRIPNFRAHSPEPNWLDDGAFELGVATYAIVDGAQALVYDTHISAGHARIVRRTLEQAGVTSIRVALSHWHVDHVAGNAVFADCEIIAGRLTAEALVANREKLETGNPPIKPLVMPATVFDGTLALTIGRIAVELRPLDIHSHDGVVAWLPETGLLLAGDTLEDPITYVAEPERLGAHLADLATLATWPVARILPNHGDPEVIAGGGYSPSLIGATQRYVEKLLASRVDGSDYAELQRFAAEDFASGTIGYFAPYEAVHRRNWDVTRGVLFGRP